MASAICLVRNKEQINLFKSKMLIPTILKSLLFGNEKMLFQVSKCTNVGLEDITTDVRIAWTYEYGMYSICGRNFFIFFSFKR